MVQIESEIINGIARISINGEIDASSSIELDECLGEHIKNKESRIAVDCNDLHYISSAGLGVFMSYIEDIKMNEQKLVLYNMSDKVKNVFGMLGLDQLMNIIQSEEEALIYLNEE